MLLYFHNVLRHVHKNGGGGVITPPLPTWSRSKHLSKTDIYNNDKLWLPCTPLPNLEGTKIWCLYDYSPRAHLLSSHGQGIRRHQTPLQCWYLSPFFRLEVHKPPNLSNPAPTTFFYQDWISYRLVYDVIFILWRHISIPPFMNFEL